MIIIIPLGGIGNRFKLNGYTKPKALINIFGKPMLYYLIDNLFLENIDYIFIPYNKEYSNFNFESQLTKDYPDINFKFYKLDKNTNGAAETINIALNNININEDKPIISLDCDNFYLKDIINKWNGNNCIFSFKDYNTNPIYSYLSINNNNNIIDIKEKEKISDFACTGAYGFNSINTLKKYTKLLISKNFKQENEFYTSGVLKLMVDGNIKIKNILLNKNDFICLGTPLLLKKFYNNYPKISCINNNNKIESKRICFDLDNTLVTFPFIKNDYKSVQPIEKNIELLRYLKKLGNIIIIYTARRMKTHKGNIGKINADIGNITFNTLKKFNIPFDEIYFGKPHADFYIDDLAVNCFQNIEKDIGFYKNIIEPRYFNNIKKINLEIILKKGNNLDGEIYYYQNIPNEIKDMFPLFIRHNDKSEYQIEKIEGITLSELYVSELLTENILINVLNSINRIQNIKTENDNINIYENYYNKLKDRYNNFNYLKFSKSNEIYIDLCNKLKNYEDKNLGKKKVIHGDPVFTNIIINNFEKIKFIDMRGKIGNKLSINGDWLYDWSKIYQSLIGYDCILQSTSISNNYKEKMIKCFEKYFLEKYTIENFKNLKLITKSHLFSLIPLHKNNKCLDYYNLIFTDYLK